MLTHVHHLRIIKKGEAPISCELLLRFKGKVKLTELTVESSAAAVELFAGEMSEYCGSARAKDVVVANEDGVEPVGSNAADGNVHVDGGAATAVVGKRKRAQFAVVSDWAASCYRLKLLKLAPLGTFLCCCCSLSRSLALSRSRSHACTLVYCIFSCSRTHARTLTLITGRCTVWRISAVVTETTMGPTVSGIDLQAVRERLSGRTTPLTLFACSPLYPTGLP